MAVLRAEDMGRDGCRHQGYSFWYLRFGSPYPEKWVEAYGLPLLRWVSDTSGHNTSVAADDL